MLEIIKTQLRASCHVKEKLLNDEHSLAGIESAATLCIEALKRGNKIIFAGNGGSAADAQHIAAELVGRFETERTALPAMALSTNTSSITAIANDYSYELIYRRQIQAFAQQGDVFVGISTSGNSKNILQAIEQCKLQGVAVVGLTGETGGKLKQQCEVCICVPSSNTARIQESHITISHIICSLIDNAFVES